MDVRYLRSDLKKNDISVHHCTLCMERSHLKMVNNNNPNDRSYLSNCS